MGVLTLKFKICNLRIEEKIKINIGKLDLLFVLNNDSKCVYTSQHNI